MRHEGCCCTQSGLDAYAKGAAPSNDCLKSPHVLLKYARQARDILGARLYTPRSLDRDLSYYLTDNSSTCIRHRALYSIGIYRNAKSGPMHASRMVALSPKSIAGSLEV